MTRATARTVGRFLGQAVRDAELAGRIAISEREMDATNRRHLLADGHRYAATIRRSVCGTLTCTYRAVGLVHGIPMCGTCGDALTAMTLEHGDDDQ